MVYQRAGELHLLGSLDVGAEPVRLEISLPGARVGREPFAVDTGQWLGEIALSQDGRAAAAGVRGTVHWLPVEQGPARTVLAEPGVRGRLPVVVPGGNAVRCVSDSGGEDGLELVPPDGEPARRLGQGRLGRVHDLAVVPDGKTAAVSSEDGRLLLVDLGETAEEPISELTRVEVDEPRQLVFSPDSGYLAWAQVWAAEGLDLRADLHVRLARLSDGAIVDVTGPRFHSHSPVFTHDGKYLALLSDQTYDPVYDGKLFDLGFPPGVRARAGEQIAAVDGRPVDPRRGPNPLLVGKAGRPVELTLRGANGDVSGQNGEVGRRVAEVPLGSEALLRDHDRISARRAQVRESSGGRLGYLHVPDLQSLGWAEFHRGFTAELARDGLVLDLRENGGGHTSALVVEKLVRRVIGWVLARQGGVSPYPHDAPHGPIVTLIDEQAGSDGDIGPNAIRTYGVGPLVGVRTWGGVVGYDRDPQLETATRLALESLQQHPAATPPALPTD